MLICLLSGSRPDGGVLSIAGMWQIAPASMNLSTTAEPSAPVPPVTTTWRSFSVCISTPHRSLAPLHAIVAELRAQHRRVAEHDLEQFTEQLADARVVGGARRRPGRR